MNLALLVYELKALGVKSLALELSDDRPTSPPAFGEERPTLAPEATSEPEARAKPEDECSVPACTAKRAGLFGGIAGGDKCRTHALQLAGVRT